MDEQHALWAAALDALANLDCLISLAIASSRPDGPMCRPEFVSLEDNGGRALLDLKAARHPCVMTTFSGDDFIPNDTTLDDACCLLLTGPNMGGKSTLLRQTCLCVILAQIGCYVPAEAARLTPTDRVFTRVGASDRILAGQSTFFVELSETSNILNYATPHSLIILDELGRGTSTYDGTAIAYAVVRHLVEKLRARTLFATHYHSLVRDFSHNPAVKLGHMGVLVDGDAVTFLYRLTDGACPKSHGVNVARLAGLPEAVLTLASRRSQEFEARAHKRALTLLSRSLLLDRELTAEQLAKLVERAGALLAQMEAS
eukprot:PLAT2594.1.p2 GENE.PLAT2594.1~~PLAT2594.1.p2  ORF type:complete len:329 (+),score=153.06 PLAT2594.1:43-987(+)